MRFVNLLEAIPLSRAKKIARQSDFDYGDILRRFRELVEAGIAEPGTSKYRVVMPLADSDTARKTDPASERLVREVLSELGYDVEDYVSGIAIDRYGRKVKIGKVLSKVASKDDTPIANRADDALKAFVNDTGREHATTAKSDSDNLAVVFSIHPYDIAGASTDRRWTSCLNIYTGSNKDDLYHLMDTGVMVAYLTRRDDLNVNDPIARKLIYPYGDTITGKTVYADTGKVYGSNFGTGFEEAIHRFLQAFNGTDWYCARYLPLADVDYVDLDIRNTDYDKSEVTPETFGGDKIKYARYMLAVSRTDGDLPSVELMEIVANNLGALGGTFISTVSDIISNGDRRLTWTKEFMEFVETLKEVFPERWLKEMFLPNAGPLLPIYLFREFLDDIPAIAIMKAARNIAMKDFSSRTEAVETYRIMLEYLDPDSPQLIDFVTRHYRTLLSDVPPEIASSKRFEEFVKWMLSVLPEELAASARRIVKRYGLEVEP